MLAENKLLSKVLDTGDFTVLNRHNITFNDFTEGKDAFVFLKSYWKQHRSVPSPSTVASECDQFEYVDTADKIEYLCGVLKDNTAKRRAFDILQNQASDKFNQLKGTEFVNWLKEEVQAIHDATAVTSRSGTNFATSGAERWQQYEEAEQSENDTIPTPYASLNAVMAGGNDIGDYLLILSGTNQGKSWLASDMALASWRSGNGVLHYSPEMSKRQTLNRLDTLDGHFSNIHIASGDLFNREEYKQYLQGFNEDQEVPYIVKTMEDIDQLSVSTIEADLQQHPEIKCVIIDGFNLMTHSGTDGNRNNMSKTSRKLRQLFVRYGVVGVVVHHTTATAMKEQNSEQEELEGDFPKAPKLTDFSETVAVIQDAVTVLTYAYSDGRGKLAVRKARKPCVDFEVNLHVNYNMGYITEVTGDVSTKVGDCDAF